MKLLLLNDVDTLKSTDNATEIELAVVDEDNQRVALERFKNITVAIGFKGSLITTESPILDIENNTFTFTISSGLPAGKYVIEVNLTNQNDTVNIAPNDGVFILTIEKSLNEIGDTITTISVQQLLDDMAATKVIAENAELAATEALVKATDAQSKYNSVVEKANAAVENSTDALTKATNAEKNANEAKTIAENVFNTVDTSSKNASTALEQSSTALKTANEAKSTADGVRAEFDKLVGESGNTDAEVINARTSSSTTHATLKARLDATDEEIAGKQETGDYATNQSVDTKVSDTLKNSKDYTDEQIASIPSVDLTDYAKTVDVESKNATTLQSAKDYTDLKVKEISTIDLSDYSTTVQIDAKDTVVLQSAKEYTDNHVPQVDISNLATKKELTEHTERKVSDGELHGLRITNGKLEFFDGSNWQTVKTDTSDTTGDTSNIPGSTALIGGTMEAGYFGTVPASEFITGDALASAIGVSEGISQYSDTDWLKFAYDGKIQFVSKRPIRSSISWDAIQYASAVDGKKTIDIKGSIYKVRLFRGTLMDPSSAGLDKGAKGSEWNKLMLPIHIHAADKSWAYPNNVESDIPNWGIGFTDVDLLTHNSSENNSYTWCQEVYGEDYSGRVVRGVNGVSGSDWFNSSDTREGCSWRPVLELVE